MSNNPVLLSTLLDLKTLGFAENSFKFDVLSLEGDRYVSIKEQDGENLTVAIIDMHNANAVTRKPMKADAVIMNPSEPVLALRAKMETNTFIQVGGAHAQVYNIETKEKVGNHQFDQKVSFWKWLSTTELAVVTDNYVYHWEVGKAPPQLMFERCGKLLEAGTKVVGYAADQLKKWCLIFGIYSNDQGATIDGAIQLYSTEKRQQQLFEGYAGTFGQLRTSNETMRKTNLLVFCEHKKNSNNIKLHLMDIYGGTDGGTGEGAKPLKVSCVLERSAEHPNDFPISIHVLDSNGLVMVLTKNGFAHFYYSTSLTYLFTERMSAAPLFASCNRRVDGKTAGALAVNRNGELLELLVDEDRLLASLSSMHEVSVGIATCYGLRGSDHLLLESFENFFANGQYKQAAQIVATLKSNQLRTPETIQRFKAQTTPTGGRGARAGNALSQYFSVLLEHGRLNEAESLELVRPVLAQNRKELVKKWMDQDKLTDSEQLGDLLSQSDHGMAFKVYTRINCHMKAIMCLIESKQTAKILTYIQKMIAAEGAHAVTHVANSIGEQVALVQGLPSMSLLVENVAAKHPEALVAFVNGLLEGLRKGEPLCDVAEVMELLIRLRRLKELNEVMLDYLKLNAKQHAQLQTRLLEINLKNDPRVAETILQLDILTQFDREYIARLCEEVGLFDYALQFYSSLGDLKRLIVKSVGTLSESTLHRALNAMSDDNAGEVLKEMVDAGVDNEVVVASAVALHAKLGALRLYLMLEGFNCNAAVLLNYLKRLPFVQNAGFALPSPGTTPTGGAHPAPLTAADVNQLVLKYLSLCLLNDELIELERVVKDNNHFDLYAAKEMLKAANLRDPKPLMVVCNRIGCVRELVEYLHNNDLGRYVETYVSAVNPASVAEVVATLLDLGTDDRLLTKILNNVRDSAGMKAIIRVAEERHQLMVLQAFLETRIGEGYREEELHTALMKIYITTGQNPEHHLTANKLYNRAQVAKYAEDIDVQLAYLVYNENAMNEELLALCLRHQLHKQLNQYLLKQAKPELYRLTYEKLAAGQGQGGQPAERAPAELGAVFDELLAMCVDNCNSNEISALIKFLLSQGLNAYLIRLLEGLLLNQTEFSTNSNLQNLLLATTIKTNPQKLPEYLSKLGNYEVNSLAKLANDLGLHHCSYQLYRKADKSQEAFDELVALEQVYRADSPKHRQLADPRLNGFEDAAGVLAEMHSFAAAADKSAIWFRLGKICLDAGMLSEAVDCYLRSGNFAHHAQIRAACRAQPELLLRWLNEATRLKQVPELVSDLLILQAQMGLGEQFQAALSASTPNMDLNAVGAELMAAGLYAEAVDVFSRMGNFNKLAVCHVQLARYDEACEAALRSKNPKVLKETFDTLHAGPAGAQGAPADAKKKLLNMLASELLNYPEFLGGVVANYEALGYFDDLIELLKRANKTVATSTELAVAIAKYHPAQLLEHLRNVAFESNSINIAKTARECSNLWLWREAVFLYTIDDSDKAVLSMILHPECFEEDLFFRTLKNVGNTEVLYKALYFCIQQRPMLVPRLLLAAKNKFDNTRLIKILKNNGCLQLAKEYFELHADRNSALVNDALYELLVEEHEHARLEDNIARHVSYDHARLCALLEAHPLRRMRDIAAKIYCRDHNFARAALVYLRNANFVRAIDCARSSRSAPLAHEVVSSLVARGRLNHFVVALVVLFHQVDVADVLETAWLSGVSLDLVAPFLIHLQRFVPFRSPPQGARRYHIADRP